MEVRIGVQHAARELVLESAQSQEDVAAAIAAAVSSTSPTDGLLRLTDEKGRVIVVPGEKLAYVEIGEPEARTVGFGAL